MVKQEASALLASRIEALRRGERDPQRAHKILLSDLFNSVLLDYKTNGYSTLRDADIRLRCHLAPFFGVRTETDPATGRPKVNPETGATWFFGGMKAIGVSNDDTQKYINKRREEGAKLATIANEVSLLRRAFNLAEKTGMVTRAPYIGLPKNFDVARTGFLEVVQYRKLRGHLPQRLRPLVSLAFHTGMRRGELLGLKWSHIDFEHRFIRLDAAQTKTRSARQIPIPAEPFEMLGLQKQARDLACPACEHVFFRARRPNERASSPALMPLGDFERDWQRACVAAGLGKMVGPEGRQRYRGLLLHDLRRSAIREILRSGTHQHVAMKIGGWKTDSMCRRYNIISEADLTAAAKRLTEHLDVATPAAPDPAREVGRQVPQLVN